MIRKPVPEDANDLARMGQAFFSGTPLIKLTDFDPASLFRLITMSGDNTEFFVLEENNRVVGAVGGVVYPLAFNNDYLVAQELFWWLDEDYRKGRHGRELYKAFEDWAKSKGAKAIFMVAIENDCVNKVERLYNYYGYSKLEHTFMKEL